VEIDWRKPVLDVFNLIRGSNPQPAAWTTYQGKTLEVFDCTKLDTTGGQAGEITGVSDAGFCVAADGGQILIQRVKPEGDKKLAASEFAAKSGVVKGGRLG